MLVLANNLTTRNSRVDQAFRRAKAGGEEEGRLAASVLQEMARSCLAAGADVLEINVQQRHDTPEALTFAVKAVQQVAGCQLCLSSNSGPAIKAGLTACKRPPIVNYVSVDEAKLADIFPLVAGAGASVVLLATDPARPSDAREMLTRSEVLLGAARDAGIRDEHVFIDPGLMHVTSELGQRHLWQVVLFLQAFSEAFDPAVRSTCWISNASVGAPPRLRHVLDGAVLAMLSGLELSSACLDVLRRENARTVRLLKILRNETIYTDRDLEL